MFISNPLDAVQSCMCVFLQSAGLKIRSTSLLTGCIFFKVSLIKNKVSCVHFKSVYATLCYVFLIQSRKTGFEEEVF